MLTIADRLLMQMERNAESKTWNADGMADGHLLIGDCQYSARVATTAPESPPLRHYRSSRSHNRAIMGRTATTTTAIVIVIVTASADEPGSDYRPWTPETGETRGPGTGDRPTRRRVPGGTRPDGGSPDPGTYQVALTFQEVPYLTNSWTAGQNAQNTDDLH